MANILFEVTVLNGSTPVTIRMSRAGASEAGTQLNGYQWLPLISKRNVVVGNWTDDGLLSEGSINHGTLSFRMSNAFENEVWSSYEWSGGLARIFVGDDGADFSTYKQTFEGSVSSIERDGVIATVGLLGPDALLDRDLLSLEYQGTGGAEGASTLVAGKLKPRVFGDCRNVDPVLIDSANWVYQVHGYGTCDIRNVYEFGQRLDADKRKANAANYDALVAMTLVPGEWATCPSQGMFRLGGAPSQRVTADATVLSTNTVATAVSALLTLAGISSAKQGNISTRTTSWCLYQTDQITIGEVARSAVYQTGGVLFADGTGTWQIMDFFAASVAVTLNADRSTVPLVKSYRQLPTQAPVWKVKIGHTPCWGVHSATEVSPALSKATENAQASADAALAAQEAAELARADAEVAKTRLDAMSNDGILDRAEKARIVADFSAEAAQQAGLQGQATNVDVSTERANLNSSFAQLQSYLNGLSPSYTDNTMDTAIDRSVFNARWQNYWLAKQTLLNKMAGVASTIAKWGGVTGTGKPEDNATVGAPAGTNVGDTPAQTVADNAKNALNALKDTDGSIITAQALKASDAAMASSLATARNEAAAAKTEGTTARQEAAQVRTDLTVTVSQAQADATAAKTSAATARSDLADEVTRAKGAEGAITTSVANLKTTVDGHTTTISDNYTTLTNSNVALANRSAYLESKTGSNGAINTNPTFALYTNSTGTPDGWTFDNQAPGAVRVAGETGGFALQVTSTAGANSYAAQTLRQIEAGTWWVIEADVKLMSGTLAAAGVLFRVTEDYQINFSTDPTSSEGVVGAGVVGRYYNFRKLVKVSTFTAAPTLYYMNHWGALGSMASANSIQWYRCAVRPASDAEIKAQKADIALNAPTTGVIARLGTEETTRTNADTALANRATNLETTVNHGTTGVAATYSKISTEETTRSNADTALSNRATSLESSVNDPTKGNTALVARIGTEETTRSNADTALANRASKLESRSGNSSGYTTANPYFAAWQDGAAVPAQWNVWQGGNFVRENSGYTSGGYMVGQVVPQADQGLSTTFYVTPGYWVYEASVWCSAGTFQGAGSYVDNLPSLNFSTTPDTNGYVGVGGPGVRSWSLMVQSTYGGSVNLYAMGNWGNFGTTTAKTIHWLKCGFRQATDGEIKAQKADVALNTPGTGVIARISTEETTRANADTALSNRATSLESTVNNGTTGVAATYSKISTEETTRGNADTALSNRATNLESTVNHATTGVAATYSKISTEETTRSNADVALANRATSLEARASGGGNLIANTDFVSSTPGVVADGWTPVKAIDTAPTFVINAAGDSWHPSNENAISIYQAGQAGVANYTGWQSTRFAVQPGTYLNAYCYMASHRCQTQLILYWTDAAGTIINASSSDMAGGTTSETNGGQNLAGWRQQGFTAVQVPANALGAVFELRKYNTNAGQGDSYAWFVRPFATVTRAGTTEFAPFSPGSAKPSANATVARISTEETTRSNADTALSNRTNTLESQLRGETGSAILTRISNEETTRANANTALATRTSNVEASTAGISTSAATNDRFANWPNASAYPTGWITWNAEGNYRFERWAASMGSPYSIRTLNDTADVESGFYQVVNCHAGKWVVEVTAQCAANSMSGAGVTLHGQYSIDFMSDPDTNGLTGDQATRTRSWVKIFDLSQAFIDSVGGNVNFHAMHGWSGFQRARAPKYVQWYRMSLRPAGPGDIAGLKNAADIISTNARIGNEETARANADSALANRTTVVEAQVSTDGNNLLRNGTFNAPGWVGRGVGGYPPYWGGWSQDNNAFVGAANRDSRYGAPAPLQIDRGGINNGATQTMYNLAPGWYALEVDITGEDGNWSGSGVHCNFNNGYAFNYGFAINGDTAGRFGDIGTANRQFTYLFYNGANATQASLYLMSGWSGFQGATNFGFFRGVWHRVVFRPATAGEIAAKKVEDSNLVARVTTTETTLAQSGNLSAYWAVEAQTPGASAYITARALTANGTRVSNVSIGGTSINLVNVEGGVTKQALTLEGGKATFYGSLRAGASITLGSGTGWPVALASKDFNVSNGEYVAFGTTLDSLPNLTFAGNGLVALNGGETYQLYAENLTRDGFTARLHISTPAQPSNYDLTSGQYSGSGLRIIDKAPRPDATGNSYNVTVTGYVQAYAVRTDYGDNCIWTEAYTHTGKKGYQLEEGDMLMVLEDDGVTYAPGPIEEIAFAREDTVLLRSVSGIELIVSKQTPVTLRNGEVIKVTEVQGHDLAVLDKGKFRWEEIVAVEEAGIRPVARIYVGDKTFAAGNEPDRFIFTHNLPVNKA